MAAVMAQVHCPQAHTAVSDVMIQVEQAQQLAMALVVVMAQLQQVQQLSMQVLQMVRVAAAT